MASEIFIYLLKVSLGLTIICLSYLLLRNDYNLRIKRFYLLSGLMASWIFPFLRFPQVISMERISYSPVQHASVTVGNAELAGTTVPSATGFDWLMVVLIIYSAGVLFILFRNLVIIRLWRNRGTRKKGEGSKIIFTDRDEAFTLFSRIFLPDKYRNDPHIEPIILHEKAHIRQLHFIDLIIVELTVLLTWFNPFTWLISRMVKENHEHLADREVLAGGINPAHYRAQLLNFSLGTNYFRLGHQFNHSLTKTRFKMMKKTKVKKTGILKYILIIPVIVTALGALTGSEVQEWDGFVKGKVVLSDTGDTAEGAAIIIKGTTTGTITDDNGRFEIECEKDDMLVFSFVGYETRELKASWITEEPVMLDFKSYEIDLETVKDKKVVESGKEDLKILLTGEDKEGPVIIVDGKRVDDPDSIDAADIEKISVIKDPESEVVKKYRADNGIVIITLKEGVQFKPEKADKTVARRKTTEEIFIVVEDMPMFPGGLNALKSYIYDNLEYPEKAKSQGIEGEVTVEFIINKEGKAENINIYKSTYKGFNDAAVKVFKGMPDWKPGRQRGKAVRVRLHIPVEFKLSKE